MKHTFSIGLFDKDTKLQQISTLEAYKIIMNLVGNAFGGGSIYEAQGFYTHDDGTMVIEPSLMVHTMYSLDDMDEKINQFCDTVKTLLNQESIYYEKTDVAISFK